ncbi:hypothetical protein ACU61A_25910 [Pseudonocardia sichuanensis]|uniref:Uncharacterized protein n=1 Tax=Pseudonocardia kunmingensis TaxID=630975 RepID=A0A543DKA5_9PSEU|nr:hypothetical protein [Pseudonocardia kunmingensis]TQM09764.1 hypothetical protein FB558_5533 [Pseudonocardia kunmingensis]
MLRASRTGLLSTRYDITCDDAPVCTWKPSAFIGGGTFELDGHRYDVARGGWTGRRYRLRDETGALVALADGVGRLAWTLETGGVTHTFERPSPFRRDQVLVRDGEPVGAVRRTSAWFGEAEADLPGLPREVAVFVLVSLLAVWDED